MAAVSWSRLIQEHFPSPFPPEDFLCSKPGWYAKREVNECKKELVELSEEKKEPIETESIIEYPIESRTEFNPQDDDLAIALLLQVSKQLNLSFLSHIFRKKKIPGCFWERASREPLEWTGKRRPNSCANRDGMPLYH